MASSLNRMCITDYRIWNPKKVFSSKFLKQETEVSIVIPVYNQEKIIKNNLLSIEKNMSSKCNFLIIDDSSNDKTLSEVLDFANLMAQKKVYVEVYKNYFPRFETYCDNFLISIANSKYILEIQADMEIREKNFDLKLVRAIKSNKSLFAISGRGTHNFESILENFALSLGTDRAYSKSIKSYIFSRIEYQLFRLKKALFQENRNVGVSSIAKSLEAEDPDYTVEFDSSGSAGRLGERIEKYPSENLLNANRIWLGETVMRGPIIIDKLKYIEVGGFNTKIFFQGFDDHELFLRANLEFGYRVGFVPIGVVSPINLGSSRRPRTLFNELLILVNIFMRRKRIKESYLFRYNLSAGTIHIANKILDF